jgi:hypothetical protein
MKYISIEMDLILSVTLLLKLKPNCMKLIILNFLDLIILFLMIDRVLNNGNGDLQVQFLYPPGTMTQHIFCILIPAHNFIVFLITFLVP